MNSLLFLSCGLALLSFLRSEEKQRTPASILKDSLFVLVGTFIFLFFSLLIRFFSMLETLEIQLLTAVLFFILASALKRDVSTLVAICGLSFWALEHDAGFFWTPAWLFGGGFLYLVFRLALGAFQFKSLFYKTPGIFAGYPALMAQSFWASVLLTVLFMLFL